MGIFFLPLTGFGGSDGEVIVLAHIIIFALKMIIDIKLALVSNSVKKWNRFLLRIGISYNCYERVILKGEDFFVTKKFFWNNLTKGLKNDIVLLALIKGEC